MRDFLIIEIIDGKTKIFKEITNTARSNRSTCTLRGEKRKISVTLATHQTEITVLTFYKKSNFLTQSGKKRGSANRICFAVEYEFRMSVDICDCKGGDDNNDDDDDDCEGGG